MHMDKIKYDVRSIVFLTVIVEMRRIDIVEMRTVFGGLTLSPRLRVTLGREKSKVYNLKCL